METQRNYNAGNGIKEDQSNTNVREWHQGSQTKQDVDTTAVNSVQRRIATDGCEISDVQKKNNTEGNQQTQTALQAILRT